EEEIKRSTEPEYSRERRLKLFKNMLKIQPAEQVIINLRQAKNHQDYFVFFEENNLYRWADKVRDLNVHGNFPTKEDYLFEVDRDLSKKFVREHYQRLHTPEVREFVKAQDGINFLKETNEIWV